MEPVQESMRSGWLTESRKDFIAGGLFLVLCLVALLFFKLQNIPLNHPVHAATLLKNFSKDLFVFKPQ